MEKYSYDPQSFRNLKKKEKDLITKDIKEGIKIFKDVGENYNINYLNYILIIESLPNDKIKNLYRFFSFRWNNLLNEDETLGKEKLKYKFKHSYGISFNQSTLKVVVRNFGRFEKKRNFNYILYWMRNHLIT